MAVGRFAFPNPDGLRLAALLDRPPGEPVAYALFSHRFTCGKDNLAASLILIHSSPAVLASPQMSPILSPLPITCARPAGAGTADRAWPRRRAVLAASAEMPEARAVVTIAAPADSPT